MVNVVASPSPILAPPSETLAFEEFRASSHFAGLDFLRGGAILLVLFFHTYVLPATSPLVTFQWNARHGVDLFFVISGFLIASLLLRERRNFGAINLPRFFARRALRLLPLYYAVLLLHVVLCYGFHLFSGPNKELFGHKLWAYLFYFSNWLPTAGEGPFFQAWSLAAEEQFYVLFGFGIVLLSTVSLLTAVGTLLCVKVVVLMLIPTLQATSPLARIAFSYQEPILYGVLLAHALDHRTLYGLVRRALGNRICLFAIPSAAVLFLGLHFPEAHSGLDAQCLYLLFAAVVATLVIWRENALWKLRLLSKIGEVSYGIYLLHMLVVTVARRFEILRNTYACFAATALVVIPLAIVIHRWFEAPIIRYYKARFHPANASKTPQTPSRSLGALCDLR